MKEGLIRLLNSINNEWKGEFFTIDIEEYVEKIVQFATIKCIWENEEIVAFIAYYENDENREMAYLTMLAIHKEYRGLGYGASLVESSINELKEKGFKYFELEVAENNLSALQLYSKKSFPKLKEIKERFEWLRVY